MFSERCRAVSTKKELIKRSKTERKQEENKRKKLFLFLPFSFVVIDEEEVALDLCFSFFQNQLNQ